MNKINLIAFAIAFANSYQLQNHHSEVDRLSEISSQYFGAGCSPFGGCQAGFNGGCHAGFNGGSQRGFNRG